MGIPLELQATNGTTTTSTREAKPQNDNTNKTISEKSVDPETTTKHKHKTSLLETAAHLFKGSVGAGLFAMGDCFKNGGLFATVLLPVLAVMCVHCEQMLIKGSKLAVQKTPGATFYDYPETVEKCFEYGPKPFRRLSKIMKLIVEMFLFVTQFGFCSVYFVFITENLHQVLQAVGVDVTMKQTMLMTLLPAMIPSLMTNLKYISPVSLIANFAMLFGLIATLTLAFLEGPMPPISERNIFTNGPKMSLFFGTALFSFEGIALILPLRNSMAQPDKFNSRFGVLNLTMVFVTGLFIFTGFVSYLRWGEDVQGSITLNLDGAKTLPQVVKIAAAMGVFFGYPIQFFIMIRIIWPPIKRSSEFAQKHPISTQVFLRFIMVMLTFGVAMIVPQLNNFISLIGAMCSTSLAFLVPVLIDFVVRAQESGSKGLNTWIYLKNIVIIIVTVLGIVVGTYESILLIAKNFG